MIVELQPQWLSYDAIRNYANSFLGKHNPSGIFPIDIEEIADLFLELNIVPTSLLQTRFGVEAALTIDRKSIWVDANLYEDESLRNRYRFTIAHELGHYYLHQRVYRYAQKQFDSSMDVWCFLHRAKVSAYDWQANAFAGLILVPSKELEKDIRAVLQRFSPENWEIDAACQQRLLTTLSNKYAVSEEVILRRGCADNYWPNSSVENYYRKVSNA